MSPAGMCVCEHCIKSPATFLYAAEKQPVQRTPTYSSIREIYRRAKPRTSQQQQSRVVEKTTGDGQSDPQDDPKN